MNAKILNRNQSAPPADGWYQIEVSGEHPAGKDRVQVIDQKALDSIVNRFKAEAAAAGCDFAGMLVDADHLSHDLDKSTAALAWCKDLDIRNGELYGQLELTDLGEAAVKGKRFKFFSTEYPEDGIEPAGPGKVRPLRIAGLAMTNRPNNRGARPMVNRGEHRQDAGGTLQNKSPADGGATKKTNMKTIAETLGLPAEATEEQILAAIVALQSESQKLKDEAAKATAGAKADEIMNRHAKRIPEASRAAWREGLITNREATEKIIAAMPELAEAKKEAPERIFNRAAASTPVPVGTGEVDAGAQADAVAAIRNRDKCNNEIAWNRARRERPDLFV